MATNKQRQSFRRNLVGYSKDKFAEQGATLHRSSKPERGPLYLKHCGKIHRTGVTMTELAKLAGIDLSKIPAAWVD
jgi:hypothetical protein